MCQFHHCFSANYYLFRTHTYFTGMFYVSQFQVPELVFIIYKAIFAVYTLVWLIINLVEAPGAEANNNQSPFVFLTTWSYILLNLYLYVSLGDALYMTYKHSRDGDVHSVREVLGHRRRHAGNKVSLPKQSTGAARSSQRER